MKVCAARNGKPNLGFYLIKDGENRRVCKRFLINTLAVSERTLRTSTNAKNDNAGIRPADQRGKYGKHAKIDTEIKESVRIHINSIPRIEGHYRRANTTREYIDGGLTIAELHRDYAKNRTLNDNKLASYDMYARIFNKELNISFSTPKKDQCELCESYKNAIGNEKIKLKANYKKHKEQKNLGRKEKKTDIKICKGKTNTVVAIYDLQAILPVPTGDISAF